MRPLFVSYFTPDYALVASSLKASLEEFGLDYEIQPMEETGSWVKNCAKKPRFLWDMMVRHRNRPIIWIDADAIVKQMPTLLLGLPDKTRVDASICRYTWAKRGVTETLSGTVYLRNNGPSQRLVDRWIDECESNQDMWDQRCLEVAISKLPNLVIHPLPVAYCFVFDFHRAEHPDEVAIIEHYQKSRQTRSKRPAP